LIISKLSSKKSSASILTGECQAMDIQRLPSTLGRAKEITRFLVERHGEAGNETQEGRRLNRRVAVMPDEPTRTSR